ncbi:MAG: lytic transglycosylase [Ectothiorhodospiraceae bacterium]|nr:lytic transglycosylase [Ectothiorhodospiraceae bacterium]
MRYTYCRQWFRGKKRPIDLWDEDAARKAHGERRPYTVLAGEPRSPVGFIEITKHYIGVGFLDVELREYLSYQFQEHEPGKLFLTMATHREFQRNSDFVCRGTTYFFKTEGVVSIEEEDFLAGTKSTRQTEADVSCNWEQYPAFNAFSPLLRVERKIPLSAK